MVRRESAEICDSFTLSYSTRQAALNDDAASYVTRGAPRTRFSRHSARPQHLPSAPISPIWPRLRATSRRTSFARSFVSKPLPPPRPAAASGLQSRPPRRPAWCSRGPTGPPPWPSTASTASVSQANAITAGSLASSASTALRVAVATDSSLCSRCDIVRARRDAATNDDDNGGDGDCAVAIEFGPPNPLY